MLRTMRGMEQTLTSDALRHYSRNNPRYLSANRRKRRARDDAKSTVQTACAVATTLLAVAQLALQLL